MRSCYRCVRRCWNTQDSNTLRGVQNSRKRFPGKASCEPGLKFIPSGVFICRTRPRLLAKVPRKGPSGVLSGSMEECVMCVANNQKLGLRFRQETNGALVFGHDTILWDFSIETCKMQTRNWDISMPPNLLHTLVSPAPSSTPLEVLTQSCTHSSP